MSWKATNSMRTTVYDATEPQSLGHTLRGPGDVQVDHGKHEQHVPKRQQDSQALDKLLEARGVSAGESRDTNIPSNDLTTCQKQLRLQHHTRGEQ